LSARRLHFPGDKTREDPAGSFAPQLWAM